MDEAELQAKLAQLAKMRAAGGLPPQLEEVFQAAVSQGLIPGTGAGLNAGVGGQPMTAPPTNQRQMVANALSKPKDLRPVDRNKAGAFTPDVDAAGNIASHRYGGTMSNGPGVPPSDMSPDDLMMHYAEQMALKEAGDPISGASGGARVTGAADTEVRPWAMRTPAGFKKSADQRQAINMPWQPPGGAAEVNANLPISPDDAPLQSVRRARGDPLVQPSAATMSDEELLRAIQQMGQ